MRYTLSLITMLLVGGCTPGAFSEVNDVDEVVSLRPVWIFTQLREKGVDTAVISFCGGKPNACRDAKDRLVILTAKCSNVFLGIIDGSEYAGVPRDLYDRKEPELWLYRKSMGANYLVRLDPIAEINSQKVGIALCPLESGALELILTPFGDF